MSTTTQLPTLTINYLTQAQYDTALQNDEIDENQLYLTPPSITADAGTNDLEQVSLSLGASGQRFIDYALDDTTIKRLEIQDDVIKTRTYNGSAWSTNEYWYSNNIKTTTTTYNSTTWTWYYRKTGTWYEFWCPNMTLGTTTFATWTSPICYHDFAAVEYPITFSTAPMIQIASKNSQSWVGSTYSSTPTTQTTIRMLANATGSRTCIVDLYVAGQTSA